MVNNIFSLLHNKALAGFMTPVNEINTVLSTYNVLQRMARFVQK
jgi:hypothetical protein